MLKLNFSALLLSCFPLFLFAQFSHIDIKEVDNGGVVPGRTYRVYAVMESEGDVIDAIFGEEDKILSIRGDKPFFQHPLGGGLASEITRIGVDKDPTLAYDSWVTIGYEDNYMNEVIAFPPETSMFQNFEDFGGEIRANNGAWFVLPDKRQAMAPEDKRILLMQLTSEGSIYGVINLHGRTAADFSETGEIISGAELIQSEGVEFHIETKKCGILRRLFNSCNI